MKEKTIAQAIQIVKDSFEPLHSHEFHGQQLAKMVRNICNRDFMDGTILVELRRSFRKHYRVINQNKSHYMFIYNRNDGMFAVNEAIAESNIAMAEEGVNNG